MWNTNIFVTKKNAFFEHLENCIKKLEYSMMGLVD